MIILLPIFFILFVYRYCDRAYAIQWSKPIGKSAALLWNTSKTEASDLNMEKQFCKAFRSD